MISYFPCYINWKPRVALLFERARKMDSFFSNCYTLQCDYTLNRIFGISGAIWMQYIRGYYDKGKLLSI